MKVQIVNSFPLMVPDRLSYTVKWQLMTISSIQANGLQILSIVYIANYTRIKLIEKIHWIMNGPLQKLSSMPKSRSS